VAQAVRSRARKAVTRNSPRQPRRQAQAPAPTQTLSSIDARSEHYAPCRVLGHEWHHIGRAEEQDARSGHYGSIGWVSSCSHCGMRRVRWFTRSGLVASAPTYTPPEGYSRHGDERLSLQEWRGVWIQALGID
jgi:hypothetical protein